MAMNLVHCFPMVLWFRSFFLYGCLKLFLPPTVVNCVQCHPFDFVVATSGIDNTIKVRILILWCIGLNKKNSISEVFWWCIILDMDSKCSCSISCSWWFSRTRNWWCVGCYGEQSTKIILWSWFHLVRILKYSIIVLRVI